MAVYSEESVLKSIAYNAEQKTFEVSRDRVIYRDGVLLMKQSFSRVYHRWERAAFLADAPAEAARMETVLVWLPAEAAGGP